MTDPEIDTPPPKFNPWIVIPAAILGFVGIGSAFSLGLAYWDSSDQDGDGIARKDDQCLEVAGDRAHNGCPNPDPDGDGLKGAEDTCPDTAGDAAHRGCPITPEEQAVIDFDTTVAKCDGSAWACDGIEAKLVVLPAADQTDERKASAAAANQQYKKYALERRIPHSTKPYQIATIESELAAITSEEERAALRIAIDRSLWMAYYIDCDATTNVCYGDADPASKQRMSRADAFQKVAAFLPFEQAYPDAKELIKEIVEEGYYHKKALYAAYEQRMQEDDLRLAFGLDADHFDFNAHCHDGRLYLEAARYGWFRAEADRCVQIYIESFRFKDGILFANRAGRADKVAEIEAALLKGAIKQGEYMIDTNGQRKVDIKVDNYPDWGGS